MRQVLIIDGVKGGVGKTTVSRAEAYRMQTRKIPCRFYDADTNVGGFARYHKEAVEQVVLDDVRSVGRIFDRLMESSEPDAALVDLGAGTADERLEWLRKSSAVEAHLAGDLTLSIAWVVGDSIASVDLLKEFADSTGLADRFVLVKNAALSGEFSFYQRSKTRQALLDAGSVEINLPKLDAPIYEQIDERSWPFDRALVELGYTARRWLSHWLDEVNTEFDRAGLLLPSNRPLKSGEIRQTATVTPLANRQTAS
jgi:hypothetical protein